MILDIQTISRNGMMIYLKKTRNDAVELLPLTHDSLEMLQMLKMVKADRTEGENIRG